MTLNETENVKMYTPPSKQTKDQETSKQEARSE